MVRYSFLVRILPPLLQAGLSRRTNIAIALRILLCGTKREIACWISTNDFLEVSGLCRSLPKRQSWESISGYYDFDTSSRFRPRNAQVTVELGYALFHSTNPNTGLDFSQLSIGYSFTEVSNPQAHTLVFLREVNSRIFAVGMSKNVCERFLNDAEKRRFNV